MCHGHGISARRARSTYAAMRLVVNRSSEALRRGCPGRSRTPLLRAVDPAGTRAEDSRAARAVAGKRSLPLTRNIVVSTNVQRTDAGIIPGIIEAVQQLQV